MPRRTLPSLPPNLPQPEVCLVRRVWPTKSIVSSFARYCRSATTACSKSFLEMRIAILTTDNREHYKDYANPVPHFGTAPEALLQGFALLPDLEIHVVSCARARLKSPEKLAPNIFFHSLYVPKLGWMRTLFWVCIQAVRRKLRELRPDLVHGQGTEGDC